MNDLRNCRKKPVYKAVNYLRKRGDKNRDRVNDPLRQPRDKL